MVYLLQANSDDDDIWVKADFPGAPALGPFFNSSGSEIHQLVADGRLDEVDFKPRFKQVNAGRRVGDLLWTTYFMKIASARFIAALKAIDATGYRSFPVDVVSADGASIGEFYGLAVVDGNPARDLYFSNGAQFWQFAVSDRVVDALRVAGATALDIKPAL